LEEDDLAGKDGLGSILSRTGWHDQHWLHAALCSIGEKLRFFFLVFGIWRRKKSSLQVHKGWISKVRVFTIQSIMSLHDAYFRFSMQGYDDFAKTPHSDTAWLVRISYDKTTLGRYAQTSPLPVVCTWLFWLQRERKLGHWGRLQD